uniref:Uncharacterized protein n=1 Tax=uncultured marine virus TaxID=186617 RepID=A0A0F7L3A5_9VIRU|nr:hypothetical protein [uncultured marine virus]
MIEQKLPNAASGTITVTNSATLLTDLMNTAGSVTTNGAVNANALAVSVGTVAVRILLDDNTPTSANGLLLTASTVFQFEDIVPAKIKLISTAGNALCDVRLIKKINK